MRRALVVGIDRYEGSALKGCVNDARAISELIGRNGDGTPNFSCKLLTSEKDVISRATLKQNIEALFKDDADMAFFYFSGHGTSNNLGGYIVTQDAQKYDEGVAMADILRYANTSKIREIVIMLDCCHSGILGNLPDLNNAAIIREGISILSASRPEQVAVEIGGRGLFTSLVCDALRGGSADLLGIVTTASVYAHVEPIFGAWDQRPLFKTHISRSTELRRCKPLMGSEILRELIDFFPTADAKHFLDKTYEPTENPKGHPNEEKFLKLQKCTARGLVKPDGEDHMYYAAMNKKSCSLTALGQFYWHLIKANKI